MVFYVCIMLYGIVILNLLNFAICSKFFVYVYFYLSGDLKFGW